MVVLSILVIFLFFEPTIISGRAYSCYTSLPCPLTQSCTPPDWADDGDVIAKADCPQPCYPSVPAACPQPCYPSVPAACPQPSCVPCCVPWGIPASSLPVPELPRLTLKKNKLKECCTPCYPGYCPIYPIKKKKNNDFDTNKICINLLSLPGELLDSLLNG